MVCQCFSVVLVVVVFWRRAWSCSLVDTTAWREALNGLVEDVLVGCASTMRVISETDGDAALPSFEDGGSDASKTRVDCRGHLIADSEAGEDDGDETQGGLQLVVVVAWLYVKQAALSFSHMFGKFQLEPANELGVVDGAPVWMLSTTSVLAVGNMMVRALLTLKHVGAVSHTGSGLQALCTKLLAHGQRNPKLAALPSLWLDDLLDKLASAEHEVAACLPHLSARERR
jgi:Putative death-receptor fusion protein (DUF2428)